jgi:outer membrane lipase/esterase
MTMNVLHSPQRRRATVTAMVAMVSAAALLSGCGSGTVFSALVPARMVVMGDGLADMGFGGTRYTVNDSSINTWVQQLASSYGLSLAAQSAGGQSWARGNARVALKPDAAGNAATLTITEQIDAFLATNTIGKDDIVVLDAGISDLIVQANAFINTGTLTEAQVLANVAEAGKALAAQARRLVAAGGTHVVVAGAYNLGKSPYATAQGTNALLENASLKYNEALLVAMVDLGANVLYIDAAYQYNLLINQPAANGFTGGSTIAACSATGVITAVTSATACTPATVGTTVVYDSYVFADDRYFTPAAQRSLGSYAYTRMKTRW